MARRIPDPWPEDDIDWVTLWECDGCEMINVLPIVNVHILEQPFTEDLSKVRCWGAMQVGGEAWKRYHEDLIHPMDVFTNMLRRKLEEYGL